MTFKDKTRRAAAHDRRSARRAKATAQLAWLAWGADDVAVMGVR